MVDIEFYSENGKFYAYLGSENCSGIKVQGDTITQLVENMQKYLLDIALEELS